jgi:hypothetical protein
MEGGGRGLSFRHCLDGLSKTTKISQDIGSARASLWTRVLSNTKTCFCLICGFLHSYFQAGRCGSITTCYDVIRTRCTAFRIVEEPLVPMRMYRLSKWKSWSSHIVAVLHADGTVAANMAGRSGKQCTQHILCQALCSGDTCTGQAHGSAYLHAALNEVLLETEERDIRERKKE